MSYLQRLGLGQSNYDKEPEIEIASESQVAWQDWPAVSSELAQATARLGQTKTIIAVESYPGVQAKEVLSALQTALQPALTLHTEAELFRSADEIDALCAPELGGDDPIFGFISRLTLDQFIDPAKQAQANESIKAVEAGIVLIYGPGALLCAQADLVVYADLARWEAQMRQRRNEVSNLGVENRESKASLQYKRAFFIDWRVADKHKRATFHQWDYVLDTNLVGEPKLVTAEALRKGLATASTRPFRVVPFFDPGPWGGQWMREVCDLSDGPPNYAWCFDCVPEENSLYLRFGQVRVEIPSINVVFFQSEALLGAPVYGRFGAEFPIRFDFLDTMGGGNLSFQVHPLIDYAREHFGLSYTQDESYYLLDAEPGAVVYLGMKEDADPDAMWADLETAQADPSQPFPDEKHVAQWPAKKHDHFLIPTGTCHCSGENSMVLEISHTPYIFTFKLWDWGRLGLDGKPRPINIERGKQVLREERRENWVREHLVNHVVPISSGDGWREESTGLAKSEFIETRRHWFTGTVAHDTEGESVHVLNLVEGAEAIVESPAGAFAPYVVHYAETFIVPAAVRAYTIRPHGPAAGQECATLKAYIRTKG